jgi:hypothetical protein
MSRSGMAPSGERQERAALLSQAAPAQLMEAAGAAPGAQAPNNAALLNAIAASWNG